MIQLAEALTNRFPQGNDWANQALRALADDVAPSTPVHDVVEGWVRQGEGTAAELIDTLFVLTAGRLGMGQTSPSDEHRRWLDLVDIVAVDAVDNSPLPLQTIELELSDGTICCVGWPESFSAPLVDVLIAIAEARAGGTEAQPSELEDPTTLAHDASGLDTLAPSPWTEQAVEPVVEPAPEAPRPIVAALDFLNKPAPAPVPEPVAPTSFEPAVFEPAVFEPAVFEPAVFEPAVFEPAAFDPSVPFDAAPFDAAAFAPPSSGPIDPPPAPDTEAWFALDTNPDAGIPVDPGAFERPSASFADGPVAGTPAGSGSVPPWETPGMTWPDPLRGVLYLGGHPGYPRKRKNGTMVFSPRGLDVRGTGFQDWDMSMDWAFVDGMEIQGPDEIMFGDHLKIDSTSSALIVTMSDATRMFFEIRTRRPPSLRSALAPVLMLVENIRGHRAQA